MIFAIVDIETTGGHPNTNRITEISIQIHDGKSVIDHYTTLVNPEMQIPRYIHALTGIDNEMVSKAPKFTDIAHHIFSLLKDRVFVAHNVNFDYSFLKHQFALCGYNLNCKKLCTVRLTRKLIPNLPSYSLGKLCNSLNIPIQNRHRAFGDAEATAILFTKLLGLDCNQEIAQMLKKGSKEYLIPPHLSKESIQNLPNSPGVYYFLNNKGKVIYVGKASSVKKRVLSHFTGHSVSKQRQEFLKNVHHIDHTCCGTELMALILEAAEIKRLWPENNRALKRYEHKYGIFDYVDQLGYIRLGIDKMKGSIKPVLPVNSISEVINLINQLVEIYDLCPRLCGTMKSITTCEAVSKPPCPCHEPVNSYNSKIDLALEEINAQRPNFILQDNGRSYEEKSVIVIEKGKFIGMGYVDVNHSISIHELKGLLQPYPANGYVHNLIFKYAHKFPQKVTAFN